MNILEELGKKTKNIYFYLIELIHLIFYTCASLYLNLWLPMISLFLFKKSCDLHTYVAFDAKLV